MKKIILITISLFYFYISNGQLSGTYNIGGDNAYYDDLTSAIAALKIFGMSGDITFLISEGEHFDDIYLNSIDGTDQGYSITFRPTNNDSSTTLINGKINIFKTNNVRFNNLTLKSSTLKNDELLIDTYNSDNIYFTNCLMYADSSSVNSSLIWFNGINDTISYKYNITNCNIYSKKHVLFYSSKLDLTIENSSIISNHSSGMCYSIKDGIPNSINNKRRNIDNSIFGKLIIKDCTIRGIIDNYAEGYIVIDNCNLSIGKISYIYGDQVTNNKITSCTNNTEMIDIISDTIVNNNIDLLESTPINIFTQYTFLFKKNIITNGNHLLFIGNDYYRKGYVFDNILNINTMFNLYDEIYFNGNLCYKTITFFSPCGCNYFLIENNVFSGKDAYLEPAPSSIVRNNTFINDAYLLYNQLGYVIMYDNNFCRALMLGAKMKDVSDNNCISNNCNSYDGIFDVINYDYNRLTDYSMLYAHHNNYYPPVYCPYEILPTFYDPMYSETCLWHSNNPLIQGLSINESPPEYDIFHNKRHKPTSTGATEVCLSSDSMNNEITVSCGEKVNILVCNQDTLLNYYWTPSDMVLYPDSFYTQVIAEDDIVLYLNTQEYGIMDSIIIKVFPFEFDSVSPNPNILFGGKPDLLTTNYHSNAEYKWSPEYLFEDPTVHSPTITVTDTLNIEVTVEVSIANCGVYYDTINFPVDMTPYVWFRPYPGPINNSDTIQFSCLSYCATKCLWDFGDGTLSTEWYPKHLYKKDGYYTVTLTGYNKYGSNTIKTVIPVILGVEDELSDEEIIIYPNPGNNYLTIENIPRGSLFEMYDISGKLLKQIPIKDKLPTFSTTDIHSGAYVYRILNSDKVLKTGTWIKE